jgi:hypothetical protein
MKNESRRVARSLVKRVMKGATASSVVESFLSLNEDLRTGPAMVSAKTKIDMGELPAKADAVADYVRENFPYMDDLRVDVVVSELVQLGVISEEVKTDSSYITLMPIERIPAGTRVVIDHVSTIEERDEGSVLDVSIHTTEKVRPRPMETVDGDGDGEGHGDGFERGNGRPAGFSRKEEEADDEEQVLSGTIRLFDSQLDLYFDYASEEEGDDEAELPDMETEVELDADLMPTQYGG